VRWTLLAAALVAVLLLWSGDRGPSGLAVPHIELVDGSLSLHNSLEGRAVFTAEDVAPGDTTSGTVSVSNAGTLAGELKLLQSDPTDWPGPAGGLLSQRLELLLEDVTSGVAATVYAGRLDGLQSLPLGTLAPGTTRVYRFTTSLPSSSDESVAGASMSVSYRWIAEGPPGPGGEARALQPRGPIVRLRVPRRQPIVSRRRLVVHARCDEPCWLAGRARLRVGRGRPVRMRRVWRRQLSANRRARLVLRIPRRSRKAVARRLERRRQASVVVTLTGRNLAGGRSTVTKRAKVRPTRRRRR
jgi:hypothetical protein